MTKRLYAFYELLKALVSFGTEGRENHISLRQVSVTEKLSTKSLLQLYKVIVIPQMEFAASV